MSNNDLNFVVDEFMDENFTTKKENNILIKEEKYLNLKMIWN